MAIKIYNKGGTVVVEDGTDFILSQFAYYAEGDNITVQDKDNDNQTWNLNYADFQNEAGSSVGSSVGSVLDYIGSLSTAEVTSLDYKTEVALGRVANSSIVNKFGFNNDIDSASEEVIASFGGAFNPLTNVITTAQTVTIAYNNTTEGVGQTGARLLLIDYLDENFEAATAYHTLSTTGSDTSAFTCLGINRVVVVQFGASATNVNDITFTATTDTTIQARIPALKSVTQQCIYHVPIGETLLMDYIKVSALKISGGGGVPTVNIKGYSFSRVTLGQYSIFDIEIDTSIENNIEFNLNNPITFTGREVIYFTGTTDINNTKVSMRFSGLQILS